MQPVNTWDRILHSLLQGYVTKPIRTPTKELRETMAAGGAQIIPILAALSSTPGSISIPSPQVQRSTGPTGAHGKPHCRPPEEQLLCLGMGAWVRAWSPAKAKQEQLVVGWGPGGHGARRSLGQLPLWKQRGQMWGLLSSWLCLSHGLTNSCSRDAALGAWMSTVQQTGRLGPRGSY